MCVDEGGPVECGGDHLCDEGDAGGAADEEYGVEVGGFDVGGAQGAGECADGGFDLGADHVFEFAAGDADVEVSVGEEDRDGGFGVDGECFFGGDAVLAESGEGDGGLGVGQVEFGECSAGAGVDVGEDGVVEVDAAEAFDAFGGAEDVDADGAFAEHGGVEGAAAEVVDGDGVAVGEVAGGGVVGGGGFGFGDHAGVGDAGELGDFFEQFAAVGAPVGGVGEDDVVWWGALDFGDFGDGFGE